MDIIDAASKWRRKLLKTREADHAVNLAFMHMRTIPHALVTAASHCKLEATATVYIIKYTNCFVKGQLK